MQGILIVSADSSIRRSLTAILQPQRTVREARTLTECLEQAAAERFDFIFLDGIFPDGTSEELAGQLHSLGYGPEIIPLLLSSASLYQRPFREFGIRFFIVKPFSSQEINQTMERVEEILRLSDRVINHARQSTANDPPEKGTDGRLTPLPQSADDIDVREVSQRFRRLLSRLRSREELVRAFADSIQEQFDADNVVALLPASRGPHLEIVCGDVETSTKSQFQLSFHEPLVQTLIRMGEPVWVHDCERLGRQNAMTAIRCGERLNIQILCPVLSRGRLKAVIGLSRFHRYVGNPGGLSLLRLFLTFFAEALENSDLYSRMTASGQIHQAMLETLDQGLIAVSAAGQITQINPAAIKMLNLEEEDSLIDQPIEKSGSRVAHHARTVLAEKIGSTAENLPGVNSEPLRIQALPMSSKSGLAEALVVLRRPPPEEEEPPRTKEAAKVGNEQKETLEESLWQNMAQAIAHNFKNAFVPLQTCAELVAERSQEPEFQNFFKETMNENIPLINNWIEQLLLYAHGGEPELNGSLSLREAVEKGIERTRRHLPEREIEVQEEYGLNDTVRGDKEKLEQVFFELARNSVEATAAERRPRLKVQTDVTESGVRAIIEDNGDGLTSDSLENLFQPFVSVDKNCNLGLGLTCAKRIIEAHGGEIELKPGADGGTRTIIILPQWKADENHRSSENAKK